MLFIHIIVCLLVTVALLSLRNNFGDSILFVIFTLIGFTTSWRQQKSDKPLPYLRIILNIIFIALIAKAFLPFFVNEPSDILGGLIKTWIYFLILFTFTISSKRDYYLVQVLAFGLVIFSCFDQTAPKRFLLNYIFTFFLIWIIILRAINLSKDINEIRQIFHSKSWLYSELKNGIIFMLTIIFLTVPLYSFIPRFNITLPFLPRFVKQKYTITYADFPGASLISFFGRNHEKMTEKQKLKAKKTNKEAESEMGIIYVQKDLLKPIFWQSPEEYESILQELKIHIEQIQNEIAEIDKELQDLSQEKNILQIKASIEERRRLNARYEELAKNIEEIQKKQAHLKEEYLKAIQEKNLALINEPENVNLLNSLDDKIKALEHDLEDKTMALKSQREELNRINQAIDEVRSAVYNQSMKSDAGPQIQRIWAKKEVLEERLETLKTKIEKLEEAYARIRRELAVQKELEKEKEIEKKKEISLFDLLIRVLFLIIFLILLFLIYCLIAFFLPYLREKNKFKKACLKIKHNLAIVLLYNFLCRVLNIFGYTYPVVIDPEDYSIMISRKFYNLRSDASIITGLFLEARYSTHKIIKEQVEKALNSYRNILKELKNTGSFWQRIILRLDFVFKF